MTKAIREQIEWTIEPPTEPGWYFWRSINQPKLMHPVHISRPIEHAFEALYTTTIGGTQPYATIGGEWWPIRIEEPE